MEQEGNFGIGMVWGISLSIPLWIAFFGWVQLIKRAVL
jgi:hypothetical protein